MIGVAYEIFVRTISVCCPLRIPSVSSAVPSSQHKFSACGTDSNVRGSRVRVQIKNQFILMLFLFLLPRAGGAPARIIKIDSCSLNRLLLFLEMQGKHDN